MPQCDHAQSRPFYTFPSLTTSALGTAVHPLTTSPLVPPVLSPADFPYKYHRSHVLLSYLTLQPLKMDLTEGSETLAIINQTPGNYPKESLLHSVHGESLKSRIHNCASYKSVSSTLVCNLNDNCLWQKISKELALLTLFICGWHGGCTFCTGGCWSSAVSDENFLPLSLEFPISSWSAVGNWQ